MEKDNNIIPQMEVTINDSTNIHGAPHTLLELSRETFGTLLEKTDEDLYKTSENSGTISSSNEGWYNSYYGNCEDMYSWDSNGGYNPGGAPEFKTTCIISSSLPEMDLSGDDYVIGYWQNQPFPFEELDDLFFNSEEQIIVRKDTSDVPEGAYKYPLTREKILILKKEEGFLG